MGAIWLHDLPQVCRAAGLRVRTWPGWELRSRSSGGYDAVLAVGIHHTASSPSRTTDQEARALWELHDVRPVGAILLARDGEVVIGAAGATNTQGKGGPYKASRGTIPLDSGNRYMISVEAANNGVGEVWPKAQRDAYVTLCAALCDGYDLDPARDVVAHFEWAPDRKIDPAGPPTPWAIAGDRYRRWDMSAFRSDVSTAGTDRPQWTQGGTVLHTADPARRLVDTRTGVGAPAGRVDPGKVVEVPIPSIADGVAGKTAVFTVTIVAPSAPGHVQIAGQTFGGTGGGNFAPTPGLPPAFSSWIAPIADGKIRLRLAGGSAHVIVDLLGVVD